VLELAKTPLNCFEVLPTPDAGTKTDAGKPKADAGKPKPDAGKADAGKMSKTDAGGAPPNDASSSGGCGCTVGTSVTTGGAWLAFGMVGLALARRRRRGPHEMHS
jgi:MYXO-CTERM domain-containing protein